MSKISVLIADDHGVVRDGVRMILNTMRDIQVVGEVGDGLEAVRMAAALKPDIVVMDLSMPSLDGIEATRRIRRLCPSVKVLILSMHVTAEHVYQAFDAGAWGYILKEAAGSELLNAVQMVKNGRRYMTPALTDVVTSAVSRFRKIPARSPMESLSKREREIFERIVAGDANGQIAVGLGLSPKTVSTYRGRLMNKLHVRSEADLVKFAVAHGLATTNTLLEADAEA